MLEPHIGKSGWLVLHQVAIESLDQAEDHLIFAAVTDDGTALDAEAAARLLTVPGRVVGQSDANCSRCAGRWPDPAG